MWEQIRYNQSRTAMLLAGMGVMLLLLSFGIISVLSYFFDLDMFESIIAGIMLAAILWLLASMFAYFSGDNMLLQLAGAMKISSQEYPRLFNIVEELKIASGLETMPAIYIVDDPAMNAFAVGCRPNKAAIIVTSGLLNKLNRDELQGVIGHEIAHITNRDVLLMSFCIMLLNTLNVMVALVTRGATLTKGYVEREPWRIGIASFVVLILAIFFTIHFGFIRALLPFAISLYIFALALMMPVIARLIYYATSRKREYLADASSALYTRYPEGLASALEKIAASNNQVLAASLATAPIYIINPFRSQDLPASDITSTHPSISERIRILRAMSHASYADYDSAYREVRSIDKGIIPPAAMAAAGIVPMRSAMPDDLDDIQRTRETSNVLWNLNNYKLISCPCGTKMRLPPSYKQPEIKCPHCGRINAV
jgi:heat shock protein HtpX